MPDNENKPNESDVAKGVRDARPLGQWKTQYPDARKAINLEAWLLVGYLIVSFSAACYFISLTDQEVLLERCGGLFSYCAEDDSPALLFSVKFHYIAIFFVGMLGSVTYSIKWLVHSVAKSLWHLDRRYWRLMTPLVGGIYANVVLTFFGGGLPLAIVVSEQNSQVSEWAPSLAMAFLIGYFSDGVSGLLTKIANVIFGTIEK